MPLSIEGRISVSRRQRDDDERFAERFGEDKYSEKLEREGVYAYGFSEEKYFNKATGLVFEIGEDYILGDDAQLREMYFGRKHNSWFKFGFRNSNRPQARHVLVLEKPFPRDDFERRLALNEVSFTTVYIYRLAELTAYEIKHRMGGGILWRSYCYIDLEDNLRKFRGGERFG